MSKSAKGLDSLPKRTPATYELRVDARLGPESAAWFEDMTLTVDESTLPVQTIIQGSVRDEAALYGLISRIRDLGLTLSSVKRIEREEVEDDKDTNSAEWPDSI
jgi:hypothetical protein